ncbi:MAG TPA: MATE family efflux transporter [Fervidobacterium nodosum]|nr:MATE family efflux transporter [Fervidobacterium nodosum]
MFKLALPSIVGSVMQSMYDIVDLFWIGRLSSKAIAGVTLFSTIFWIVEILNEIIGTSSVSMISQSYGKGDKKLTSKIIEQTLIFKAFVAVLASAILLVVLKPLMYFYTKDIEAVEAAIDYGYIRVFFMFAFFMTYSTFTALRNIGSAHLAMVNMVTGSIVNIFLDPIFMFDRVPFTNIRGLNMGISGAAWATVVSTFISLGLGLFFLFRGVKDVKISLKGLFVLDWKIDAKLMTIGLPTGGEMLLRTLSYAFLIKFASGFGSEYISTIGILERIIGFSNIPIFGLSMATSTLVGFFLGKDDEKEAKNIVFVSLLYGLLIISIAVVVLITLRSNIYLFFTNDMNVIRIGSQGSLIVVPTLLFTTVSWLLSSGFFGAGLTIFTFISSFLSRWAIMIPYLFITVSILKLSAINFWLSFMMAELFEMFLVLYFFMKYPWTKKRVV